MKKKVIFVTYDFPYPHTSGGKVRAYNLLKHAAKEYEIVLFSFTRKDYKPEYSDAIKKIGISKVYTFPRKPLKDIRNLAFLLRPSGSIFRHLYFDKKVVIKLQELIRTEKIDLVHFESFYTSFYIPEIKKTGVKIVFGEENIEYNIYQEYASSLSNIFLRPFYKIEALKIHKEEVCFWRESDLCLAVTAVEAELIRKKSGTVCEVIENGIDINAFKFKERHSNGIKKLLFVGNFSYYPNVDAVKYLYRNIFRTLNEQKIKLIIIGKGATSMKYLKNYPGVELLDFVEDIREAYTQCDIFVFPVRYGGGTNFKILEAMATGIPIVAVPDRVRGLGVEDGKHMLIASGPEEFRKNILKLVHDHEKYKPLTYQARKLVEEKYDWKVIGDRLCNAWKGLLS
jgi:polysaccharide biosynthesis protein PslH